MTSQLYAGLSASLPTLHGKEQVIAPIFWRELGINVHRVEVNTDAFGTFSGERPLKDTPLATAVAKARAGIAISGNQLALASEGTIGPDPISHLFTCDVEIVVFLDTEIDIIIFEAVRSFDIVAHRAIAGPMADLRDIMMRADMPNHAVIVRPDCEVLDPLFKGITDEQTLTEAIRQCSELTGKAIIESDFRAHVSPSRMKIIANCATRLATRIATPCPECLGPGWGLTEPILGLPCAACNSMIDTAVQSDQYTCPQCPARIQVPRIKQSLDPRWCLRCNP